MLLRRRPICYAALLLMHSFSAPHMSSHHSFYAQRNRPVWPSRQITHQVCIDSSVFAGPIFYKPCSRLPSPHPETTIDQPQHLPCRAHNTHTGRTTLPLSVTDPDSSSEDEAFVFMQNRTASVATTLGVASEISKPKNRTRAGRPPAK